MKTVGIAWFGLNDSISFPDGYENNLEDKNLVDEYRIEDVLLPDIRQGRVLCGEEAENERVHVGLNWPPEARILPDDYLKRAALPLLWRALCGHGEESVFWKSGKHAEFPIADLLVSSIENALQQCFDDENGWSGGKIRPAIAIPELLHEVKQEAILSRCNILGLTEPYLIWRSVAACLSWLEQNELQLKNIFDDFHNNYGVAVLYFGVDAIEMSVLRLKQYNYGNKSYILPLRTRPQINSALPAGMDWAGNIIENICALNDRNAFWQLFTSFPEIWQALAGKPYNHNELPRVWSTSNGWKFWNPSNLSEEILKAKACNCGLLYDISKKSFDFTQYKYKETFVEKLVLMSEELLAKIKNDNICLLSTIVCGPLISENKTQWLCNVCRPLTDFSQSCALSSSEQSLSEYISNIKIDIKSLYKYHDHIEIAHGANIYARRTEQGIPAYLDTMEQISLLTQNKSGQQEWIPLLNTLEVLGGHELKGYIEGRFQLQAKTREMDFWLCMGETPKATKRFPEEPKDIAPCRRRVIRQWVRQQDSIDSVKRVLSRSYIKSEKDYISSYSSAIFQKKIQGYDALKGSDNIRRNKVLFPSLPDNDILLDVELRIKPAAGRASIYFIPKDESFLEGKKIKLNYAKLEKNISLPSTAFGWPSRMEIVAHPYDISFKHIGDYISELNFYKSQGSAFNRQYNMLIDDMLKPFKQSKRKYDDDILNITVHSLSPVDENGFSCTNTGNNTIDNIREFLYSDFTRRLHNNDKKIDHFAILSTYLYNRTPENIKKYFISILNNSNDVNSRILTGASRCLTTREEIRALFNYIVYRSNGKYNTSYVACIRNILQYREEALDELDDHIVLYLLKKTFTFMNTVAEKYNFKNTFFQCSLAILYLLRYRKKSPSFFEHKKQTDILEKCIQIMNTSTLFCGDKKFQKYKNAADMFEKYVHMKSTSLLPLAIAELADIKDNDVGNENEIE